MNTKANEDKYKEQNIQYTKYKQCEELIPSGTNVSVPCSTSQLSNKINYHKVS